MICKKFPLCLECLVSEAESHSTALVFMNFTDSFVVFCCSKHKVVLDLLLSHCLN